MSSMFNDCIAFNQDIGNWDTTNVTDMNRTFRHSRQFNQDISAWDVSNVINMELMLYDCQVFNQDLSVWNVSSVANMGSMFRNCFQFNQDVNTWDVSNVTDMTSMFDNSGVSADNYDNILIGWSSQALQSNVAFGADGLTYCSGEAARQNLIDTYGWTITDGGRVTPGTDCPSLITWTGSYNSDWATAENWDSGVPSSSDNVTIPDVTNAPIINGSTNASVNDLTITEPEGLTINSGGSLIVSGTSTGNVTYNRNLASPNWYLVSSPVIGETYDDAYVTANSISSGTGNNRGIAPYTTSDDSWDYMQSGETATFTSGNGYSVIRTATGDISFTGILNVADDGVDVVLSNTGNRFNLLGNPYTSNIASATFLNNEAAVSETQTLWVWNQAIGADGAYEVKTVADAMIIAPSQGFFVKANEAGGTFNFSESNQIGSGGTFQRTGIRPEIYLTISDQTDAREARIYYIENMTTGFDVGYEGELFNGVSNPLAIYTHLVSDSDGQNYQVQSLPTNNYENMIVPLGVNAASGSAITIDISTNNFPDGVNIYLEDKQDNSFTLLNADTNFSTTLDNSLSGIGRFYLHTTSGVLSTDDVGTINNISIYKSSNENLRIVGVQNGKATVQIYNILGKEVLETSFDGNGVNNIKLNNLSPGLYILKLATEKDTINKKIIIQSYNNE